MILLTFNVDCFFSSLALYFLLSSLPSPSSWAQTSKRRLQVLREVLFAGPISSGLRCYLTFSTPRKYRYGMSPIDVVPKREYFEVVRVMPIYFIGHEKFPASQSNAGPLQSHFYEASGLPLC